MHTDRHACNLTNRQTDRQTDRQNVVIQGETGIQNENDRQTKTYTGRRHDRNRYMDLLTYIQNDIQNGMHPE